MPKKPSKKKKIVTGEYSETEYIIYVNGVQVYEGQS